MQQIFACVIPRLCDIVRLVLRAFSWGTPPWDTPQSLQNSKSESCVGFGFLGAYACRLSPHAPRACSRRRSSERLGPASREAASRWQLSNCVLFVPPSFGVVWAITALSKGLFLFPLFTLNMDTVQDLRSLEVEDGFILCPMRPHPVWDHVLFLLYNQMAYQFDILDLINENRFRDSGCETDHTGTINIGCTLGTARNLCPGLVAEGANPGTTKVTAFWPLTQELLQRVSKQELVWRPE